MGANQSKSVLVHLQGLGTVFEPHLQVRSTKEKTFQLRTDQKQPSATSPYHDRGSGNWRACDCMRKWAFFQHARVAKLDWRDSSDRCIRVTLVQAEEDGRLRLERLNENLEPWGILHGNWNPGMATVLLGSECTTVLGDWSWQLVS